MQNSTTNVRKLTGTAMLGAVAAVLMYLEFPIPIMPSFVKLDVSELPALLAAYAYGPLSGIAVCLIKNLIKLPSTSTAAVGELFNFVMGALFVGVAGFVYKRSKTRRSALIGARAGALVMAVVSVPYNYFIVYPAYVVMYHLPLEAIIGIIPGYQSQRGRPAGLPADLQSAVFTLLRVCWMRRSASLFISPCRRFCMAESKTTHATQSAPLFVQTCRTAQPIIVDFA